MSRKSQKQQIVQQLVETILTDAQVAQAILNAINRHSDQTYQTETECLKEKPTRKKKKESRR